MTSAPSAGTARRTLETAPTELSEARPARDRAAWRRAWTAMRSRNRPYLLIEIALIVLLLTVYDHIKDVAHARAATAIRHGLSILHLEDRWNIGVEAAANHWLAHERVLALISSYEYQFAWASCAVAGLVVAWIWRPAIYRRARNAMLLINGIALAVFFVFPTAPPRLLPGAGYHDLVAAAGFGTAHDGPLPADQYAAMPSLHLGWSVFTALLIWRLTRNRLWRAVAVAYPTVTAAVVIASANHYVLDVLAGTALALGGCLVTGLLPARWPAIPVALRTRRLRPLPVRVTRPVPIPARSEPSVLARPLADVSAGPPREHGY